MMKKFILALFALASMIFIRLPVQQTSRTPLLPRIQLMNLSSQLNNLHMN